MLHKSQSHLFESLAEAQSFYLSRSLNSPAVIPYAPIEVKAVDEAGAEYVQWLVVVMFLRDDWE